MEKITELGKDLWLAKANVDELIEQEMNPNSMSNSMFNQLTSNIKKRGALEQLPYCATTKKGIEIIGGHHRVRSARKAGIQEIHILLDTSNLTRDQIIAKQLAHNNINGMRDPELTMRLYTSILDADAKIEAYVDAKKLMQLITTDAAKIKEIALDFDMKSVALLFLPHQITDMKKAIEETVKRLDGKEKEIWIAQQEQFDDFKKALNKIRKVENIRNISMAIHKMSQITVENLHNSAEKKGEGK